MALFGLKSKRSRQSDTSSIRKDQSQASFDRPFTKSVDTAIDSHSLRSSPNRRTKSTSSDASSLHSRTSSNMLKLFGSTRRRASKADVDSPTLTASNEFFGRVNSSRASQSGSVAAMEKSAASSPVLQSLPSMVSPATAAAASWTEPIHTQNDIKPSGLVAPLSPTSAKPKPSELFAGKGVQWNDIDLTSRDFTTPVTASRNQDMQKFLKARRQWIPTFKTEETVLEESDSVSRHLENLEFQSSGVENAAPALLSLNDLEESHKRKKALTNQLPVISKPDGTIFDETGVTGHTRSVSSNNVALPRAPFVPLKNQSFRSSTFVDGGSAPSFFGPRSRSLSRNSGTAAISEVDKSSPPAAKEIPTRRESLQKLNRHSDVKEGANGSKGHTRGVSSVSIVEAIETAEPDKPTSQEQEQEQEQQQEPLDAVADTQSESEPAPGPESLQADTTSTESKKTGQEIPNAQAIPADGTTN